MAITYYNISLKKVLSKLLENSYYKANDSIVLSTSGAVQYAGKWANATSLRFTIPLDKPVASGTTITVTGYIYASAGGSGGSITLGSGNTVSCELRGTALGVLLTFNSSQSMAKPNYACAVQSAGLEITFS